MASQSIFSFTPFQSLIHPTLSPRPITSPVSSDPQNPTKTPAPSISKVTAPALSTSRPNSPAPSTTQVSSSPLSSPSIDTESGPRYPNDLMNTLNRIDAIETTAEESKAIVPAEIVQLILALREAAFALSLLTAMSDGQMKPTLSEDFTSLLEGLEKNLESWKAGSGSRYYNRMFTEHCKARAQLIISVSKELEGIQVSYKETIWTQQQIIIELKETVALYSKTSLLVSDGALVESTEGASEVVVGPDGEWFRRRGDVKTIRKLSPANSGLWGENKWSIHKMIMDGCYFVCAKTIGRRNQDENESWPKEKLRMKRLIELWKDMNHPNILPLFGVCNFENDKNLYLISPWMKNGNAWQFMTSYPQADRLRLIHEVAFGVQYLHSKGIVHGKLRPDNVLVDLNHRARLSGFSLSKNYTGKPQTVDWLINNNDARWNPMDQQIWTKKSDVWSWGMTALAILSGERPFPDLQFMSRHIRQLDAGILRPKREDYRSSIPSDELWYLLARCWSTNENDRPDMDVVVSEVCKVRMKAGWNPLDEDPKAETKRDWDWPTSY